ncbi:hypothetical protein D3C72_1715570 [compost metagenome]
MPAGHHHVSPEARTEHLPNQHHQANTPQHFAANDKQHQAAKVGSEVQHLGVRGGFGQVKTAQRHVGQRIEGTGTGPKEAIVKTDAATGHQPERQGAQTALPIVFPQTRRQQEVQADADHQ